MSTFPCPRCGRRITRTFKHGHPPEIRCRRCGFLMFDYPRPCAGMIVVRGRNLLVLRRAHPPRKGRLDLPGGFMEAGEAMEQAARRELREETGLELGSVRPLGLYWDRYFLKGFGHFPTMNFYFIGRWRGGEPRPADDAAKAEWIPMGELGKAGQRLAWKHMRDVLRDVVRFRTVRPA